MPCGQSARNRVNRPDRRSPGDATPPRFDLSAVASAKAEGLAKEARRVSSGIRRKGGEPAHTPFRPCPESPSGGPGRFRPAGGRRAVGAIFDPVRPIRLPADEHPRSGRLHARQGVAPPSRRIPPESGRNAVRMPPGIRPRPRAAAPPLRPPSPSKTAAARDAASRSRPPDAA